MDLTTIAALIFVAMFLLLLNRWVRCNLLHQRQHRVSPARDHPQGLNRYCQKCGRRWRVR